MQDGDSRKTEKAAEKVASLKQRLGIYGAGEYTASKLSDQARQSLNGRELDKLDIEYAKLSASWPIDRLAAGYLRNISCHMSSIQMVRFMGSKKNYNCS